LAVKPTLRWSNIEESAPDTGKLKVASKVMDHIRSRTNGAKNLIGPSAYYIAEGQEFRASASSIQQGEDHA
jgi:hypothetical protein